VFPNVRFVDKGKGRHSYSSLPTNYKCEYPRQSPGVSCKICATRDLPCGPKALVSGNLISRRYTDPLQTSDLLGTVATSTKTRLSNCSRSDSDGSSWYLDELNIEDRTISSTETAGDWNSMSMNLSQCVQPTLVEMHDIGIAGAYGIPPPPAQCAATNLTENGPTGRESSKSDPRAANLSIEVG
jgi:hypothetical protein